jgi:polyhydroxyalkanoate synthase subunit PhaC
VDPETWLETVPEREGSWWQAWEEWLSRRSSERTTPPTIGNPKNGYVPLADAPGTYVLQE